jgi:alkanesulfonate monooxygenase SsuD/methylene tetrahydromethanopterin reductase-like flavin-dependent oxidoreductase (luciferase family)
MQFGVYALPSYHPELDGSQGAFMRGLVELLAAAEPLGFDAIWLNEHHFHSFGGMIPAPAVLLAALAQRTSRVTLGTSIIILPMHHPIEIAEQLAMVDLMSNGRVQLGVGRGFVVYDYEVMGLPYENAQERLVEGLDVVLDAWRGARFSHEGRFYHYRDLEVWPPGQQQPGPPVWISCSRNPASFEWTARQGYGLLTIGFISPVPKSAALTRVYREAWTQPEPCQIGTLYHAIVAESGAKARQIALPAVRRFLAQKDAAEDLAAAQDLRAGAGGAVEDFSVERMVDEARLIAGSPAEVVDELRYLERELGFTQVDLMFQLGGLPFETARESMELFAAEVMPKLRAS